MLFFFLNQPVRFFPEVAGQAACQFEIGLQIFFGHPAVSPLFRLLQTVDRPVCQRLTGSRQKDFFVVAGAGNRDQLHEAVFHKAVDGCVNCLLGINPAGSAPRQFPRRDTGPAWPYRTGRSGLLSIGEMRDFSRQGRGRLVFRCGG